MQKKKDLNSMQQTQNCNLNWRQTFACHSHFTFTVPFYTDLAIRNKNNMVTLSPITYRYIDIYISSGFGA